MLVLAKRERYYSEHGWEWPEDSDGPVAVTDLVALLDDPVTEVTLSWTVPADMPDGDPATYEVRYYAADSVDDWPGWASADVLAADQEYGWPQGGTQTLVLAVADPAPSAGYLFCVRSSDANTNESLDGNVAQTFEEPGDETPPDAVTDFSLTDGTLTWSVPYDQPGDDVPATFSIRWILDGAGPVVWDSTVWAAATELVVDTDYSEVADPVEPGQTATYVDGAFSHGAYEQYLCYCVRSKDADANESDYSNCAWQWIGGD